MTDESRIPRRPDAHAARHDAAPADGDKTALRSALRAARRTLEPARKADWDARICARVLAWCAAHDLTELGVYWPLRGEPELAPAYAALAQAGVRLALPVVLARAAPLGFLAWVPGEAMENDALGVAVPALRRALARPSALLLPCLGFNAAGYRLGYGGGYYDRTLAAMPRPRTAGVAYANTLADFAGAPHDVALDVVITEAS